MNQPPIFAGDLQPLLQKKIELLRKWFDFAQRQFASIDSSSLTTILQQKDEVVKQLEQTDHALKHWHAEHSREYTQHEKQLLSGIELALQSISQSEDKFQEQLQQQLNQISLDLQQLAQQEKARRYFKTQAQVGQLLRVKQ